MEFAHLLGKEIKALREDAGITQSQLAVKIEKDTDYISKLERGLRMPSLKTLIRIADLFNVKLSEVFKRIEINQQ